MTRAMHVTDKVDHKVYTASENPMGIDSFYLTFDKDGGAFHYSTPRGNKSIRFGFSEYVMSEFPETHYYGRQMHVPLGHGYRSMSAAAWNEEHKLLIRTYVIDDFFGNLTITLSFKGDLCTVYMEKTAEGFLSEYHGEMTGTCR